MSEVAARLHVTATMENLPAISEFVRDAGRRLEWSEDVSFDIDLAVEEASTNIVRHAYGPDDAGDLEVQVETTKDAVRVTLTDWGRPFDGDSSYLEVEVPLETRAKGGMGVRLIHGLMDSVTRQTAKAPGGPNVLTLVRRLDP